MTPAEQDRAFRAAVKLAAGERGAIQNATAAEVTRLLKEAAERITTALEGQPSDYLAWYWPQLRREIEATLREFGEAAGTAATEGQTRAWTAGQALIDAPLTAAAVGGVVARLPGLDTRPLLAMQLFLTGKMKDVGQDAVSRVNGELALTMIGAQGVGATITRIQEVMGGVSRRRAITIVRTELGRAFAAASQQRSEQAVEYLPELRKQWRRSGKIHSRLKHDLTDGQVRPVDQPFILGTGHVSDPAAHGGIRIMYPHDPAAPPAETINCGCISLPYMASWKDAGVLTDPGKRPFSEREIALNPVKQELAGPGLTMGEIVAKQTINVRTVGSLTQDFMMTCEETIKKIPQHLVETFNSNGGEVILCEKLTMARPDLKGKHPRGWPKGMTWDHSDGCGGKDVHVANQRLFKGKWVESDRAEKVLCHEFGHCIDDALGYPSQADWFKMAYAKDVDVIPEADREWLYYFLQAGDAGRSEAFAELMAHKLGAAKFQFDRFFKNTLEAFDREIFSKKS